MNRSHGLPVAVLVTVLAAGCSGAPGDPDGKAAQSPPPPTREVRDLVLPLDSYALESPELALVQSAENALIRRCMARQGLKWTFPERRKSASWPNRGRYGLIEDEAARRFGYHPIPDPEAEKRTAQYEHREGALDRRERSALHGAGGREGCRDRARATLLRGVPKVDWQLIDRTGFATYRDSRRSTAVVNSVREWSSCMRDRGFVYGDPMAANDDARWRTPGPSRAERATAVADVRCKHRAGLVNV